MTKVTLFDETAGIAVAGELSATWQSGKAGDSSEVAQAAELILLSPQGDLWIDRLSDPDMSKPADPKGPAATCCQAAVTVKPGWAPATSIKKIMQPALLPPEFVSADPTQSRVSGVMAWATETATGPSAMEALFGALPPGVAFIPPIPMAVPETFGPRGFSGILTLPFLKRTGAAVSAQLPALPQWFTATILLDDALTGDGTLQEPTAPHGALVAMCLDPTTWVGTIGEPRRGAQAAVIFRNERIERRERRAACDEHAEQRGPST